MTLLGLILLSLALGLAAWAAFVWSVRSGQYEDPEGPKYRMLDDEEDATSRSLPDQNDSSQGDPSQGAQAGERKAPR